MGSTAPRRTRTIVNYFWKFWSQRTAYEDAWQVYQAIRKNIDDTERFIDASQIIDDHQFEEQLCSSVDVLYKKQSKLESFMDITKTEIMNGEIYLMARGYSKEELGDTDWDHAPYAITYDLFSRPFLNGQLV